MSSPSIDATDAEIAASPLRLVSCKTVLACLGRVCGTDDKRMTALDIGLTKDIEEGVLPVERLIGLAEKSGLHLRAENFSWRGLLIATASKTILLPLKNGNVVAVLGTGREGVEEIVVSDPLYQDGEPFFLPRLALEHAWRGEALIVKPKRRKGERALVWYLSILSVFGLVGGFLLLSQAAIDVTIAGSHASSSESTLGGSAGETTTSVLTTDNQTAAVSASAEMQAAGNTLPSGDKAADAAGTSTAGNPAEVIAAASAAEVPNSEQAAPDSSKARPMVNEAAAGTQQIAARSEDKRAVEPVAGEAPQRPPLPADTTAPIGTPATKAPARGLSAAEIQALLARGDTLIAKGDVASARLFYERAAEAGDGQAALRLGESYDPAFLAQAHLSGARGDAQAAARWYGRARELGITEAESLLRTLAPEKDQRLP